ncbi:MAG: NAD-dependent epimerase/dehydratase family protein, partial [Candidatus Marinimicrobia bacterium]|nr:NAD-dependent epimerase/dehydratase family protein [Candidatus Neomarinimicrobiota bacterium]
NTDWLEQLGDINYVTGELTRPESLADAVTDMDVIFHLAGAVIAVDREGYFRINRDGTANLLNAALQHNPDLQNFIYVSTQAAGGPTPHNTPRTEDMPPEPVTHYGASKLAAEEFLQQFTDQIPIKIIRPPSVYGPHDIGVFTFFQIVDKHLQVFFPGQDLQLSLIYVQDLVRGILQIAEHEIASGEVFYIDDGNPRSMRDIQTEIARALDVSTIKIPIPRKVLYPLAGISELIIKLRKKPSFFNIQKIKEITQPAWTCSSEKLKQTTGFTPEFSLSEGAKITAKWYKSHGWL